MSEARVEELDDVNKAIRLAKAFLLKAYEGETIENLGLEEVRQNHGSIWDVTLGFNRRWDHPQGANSFLQMAALAARPQRTYKLIQVDLSGPTGLSITNRKGE